MNFMKSFSNIYNKLSNFGKILLFITILLILAFFFKYINSIVDLKKEGYQQNDNFVFIKGDDVYDDFYSAIYDKLVFNNLKNDYEIEKIMNETKPNNDSVILDIGCGTGHHVNKLSKYNLNIIGIDSSQSMINTAKNNYPECKFMIGNAMNLNQFNNNTFTHILCLYFTIYYFKNKDQFFNNCFQWLSPGGYLVIHVVDREKFDPILPPGNPLYIVSPQKYAKERITKTKITFDEFVYDSNFNFDKNNDIAVFEEKINFKNGKTRKQEQILYMEDSDSILQKANNAGFILEKQINLVECAYENQYLYIFIKPS